MKVVRNAAARTISNVHRQDFATPSLTQLKSGTQMVQQQGSIQHTLFASIPAVLGLSSTTVAREPGFLANEASKLCWFW